MDPRLEVLTRPRDGASATVEEEHGATTVTLSWADGAELQAVQYRENDHPRLSPRLWHGSPPLGFSSSR